MVCLKKLKCVRTCCPSYATEHQLHPLSLRLTRVLMGLGLQRSNPTLHNPSTTKHFVYEPNRLWGVHCSLLYNVYIHLGDSWCLTVDADDTLRKTSCLQNLFADVCVCVCRTAAKER